jgi:hypothetical protein
MDILSSSKPSVGLSVGGLVVGDSVGGLVGLSVGASVGLSVGAAVGGHGQLSHNTGHLFLYKVFLHRNLWELTHFRHFVPTLKEPVASSQRQFLQVTRQCSRPTISLQNLGACLICQQFFFVKLNFGNDTKPLLSLHWKVGLMVGLNVGERVGAVGLNVGEAVGLPQVLQVTGQLWLNNEFLQRFGNLTPWIHLRFFVPIENCCVLSTQQRSHVSGHFDATIGLDLQNFNLVAKYQQAFFPTPGTKNPPFTSAQWFRLRSTSFINYEMSVW